MQNSVSVTPGVGHRVLPTILLPAALFMFILLKAQMLDIIAWVGVTVGH